MKFELTVYPRGLRVSNEELIADLQRVARELDKNSVTHFQYKDRGKYGMTTFIQRFGSWLKALEKAGLQRGEHPHRRVSNEDLIADLQRVARELDKNSVTHFQYADKGEYSVTTFVRHFGNWSKAVEKAGLQKTVNVDLTEEDLFKNLEEVWIRLGRQPKYAEVLKPLSKYHVGTYENRFGTWRKALEKFVAYINKYPHPKGRAILITNNDEPISSEETIKTLEIEESTQHKISRRANRRPTTILEAEHITLHKTNKGVNWRLRFIVMRRDNFKCKICGRSPATDQSIVLHVDHIKPYSKGGETRLENLQTLCSMCNIGKSNEE